MYAGLVPPVTLAAGGSVSVDLYTPLQNLLADIAWRIRTDPAFAVDMEHLGACQEDVETTDADDDAMELYYDALDSVMHALRAHEGTKLLLGPGVAPELAKQLSRTSIPVSVVRIRRSV